MFREDFNEKFIFKENFEGGEGVRFRDIWGMSFLGREIVNNF